MRAVYVILLCFIAASAMAEPFKEIVAECWKDRDHSQMSACVEDRAAKARERLSSVENLKRIHISDSKEGAAYVKAAITAFDAAAKSFRKYREDQCSLVAALASKGNGA